MKFASWPAWKKGIAAALALLVIADVVLAVILWQISRQGPEQMRMERAQLSEKERLLRADVDRGHRIRASLPLAGKQCDDFYEKAFLNATTGYSQIESDLNSISQSAGVQTSGLKFERKEVQGRGVTQVDVSTKVTADYPSLIRFINGVERSKDFYLLDGMKMESANGGMVVLQVRLHTYFRT